MENKNEYKRVDENKSYYNKKEAWHVAVQLELIDNNKPTEKTEKLAKNYIEDKISITEFKEQVPNEDLTFVRITELLVKREFSFSPLQLKYNHLFIFNGIFEHAGKFREYDIEKEEYILNGKTVNYG